eukprot:scaffold4.g5043.t1
MQFLKQRAVTALENGAETVRGAAMAVTGHLDEEGGDPADGQQEGPPAPGDRDWGQASGHWTQAHHGGPLERVKEGAAHAVEGVKHALESVVHHHPTAEERTGESMHMARAAEGRNIKEDDSITRALHEETLGDAISQHSPATDAARADADLAAAEEAAGGRSHVGDSALTTRSKL